MGMKRGAFESASLSQVADSAKNPNVQIDSVARGLRAMAKGFEGISSVFNKLGGMADAAYGDRVKNQQAAEDSLLQLTESKGKLAQVREAYKGRENTPEAKNAIDTAERTVNAFQEKSDLALDRYARTGWFIKKIGSATVESGAARRVDAEARAAEYNKGKDKKDHIGVLQAVDHQSLTGFLMGQSW